MEFLRGILTDIKISRKIAREERERKRRKSALEKYFNSDSGKRHLEVILKDLSIEDASRTRIVTIDNDLRDFRLAVDVDEDVFRNILRSKIPKAIKYRITNQNDAMDAGNLLVEVDDKVAIQTSGIIFPQASSIKGILYDLYPEVSYVPIHTEVRGFQPWREMVLRKAQ